MKKYFVFLTCLILIVIITVSSCSYRIIDFTVISSKNHSLMIDKSKGIRVEGSSNGFLGFGASIKAAMDIALEQAGADYDLLIDGVVMQNDYFFVVGYKVTGIAIRSRELKAFLGEDGFENWCKENNVFDPELALIQK